jgi:hypothetical protein
MKKVLKYLIIILLSLTAGWFIGHNSSLNKSTEVQKVFVEKIKEKIVRDTIKVKEPVYIEKSYEDSLNTNDTLSIAFKDTSGIFNLDSIDQIIDADIIREELMSTLNLDVEWITKDSLDVSELLNKKANSFNEKMIIEFWQSPLNLTGYELTRNRLKLFGFNPNESISLQLDKNNEQILLSTESMSIVLKKSKQFKTLKLK